MQKLSVFQQQLVAEKLLDIGNVAAGALLFGQLVADRVFSALLAAIGVGAWIVMAGCAIILSRERNR